MHENKRKGQYATIVDSIKYVLVCRDVEYETEDCG